MVEGARLESVYVERHRGFESLPHRHLLKARFMPGFFISVYCLTLRYLFGNYYADCIDIRLSDGPQLFKAALSS